MKTNRLFHGLLGYRKPMFSQIHHDEQLVAQVISIVAAVFEDEVAAARRTDTQIIALVRDTSRQRRRTEIGVQQVRRILYFEFNFVGWCNLTLVL